MITETKITSVADADDALDGDGDDDGDGDGETRDG